MINIKKVRQGQTIYTVDEVNGKLEVKTIFVGSKTRHYQDIPNVVFVHNQYTDEVITISPLDATSSMFFNTRNAAKRLLLQIKKDLVQNMGIDLENTKKDIIMIKIDEYGPAKQFIDTGIEAGWMDIARLNKLLTTENAYLQHDDQYLTVVDYEIILVSEKSDSAVLV